MSAQATEQDLEKAQDPKTPVGELLGVEPPPDGEAARAGLDLPRVGERG